MFGSGTFLNPDSGDSWDTMFDTYGTSPDAYDSTIHDVEYWDDQDGDDKTKFAASGGVALQQTSKAIKPSYSGYIRKSLMGVTVGDAVRAATDQKLKTMRIFPSPSRV